MKILIAADMEGITGVTHWDQVDPAHPEYQRFRKFMTGDVNAAIVGAFEGGAREVLVTDGHWDGWNLLLDELDPRARLNAGLATSPFSMMQGIDGTFDGVLFVGYHARAGSENANLDHTWTTRIANLWLNEQLVGESGLNAALAGSFGVPVIMISGDQTACAQAVELIGPIETAVIKTASGRYSAECLPMAAARALIRGAASRALARLKKGGFPEAYVLAPPIEVTVEFMSADSADRAARVPGAHREGTHVAVLAPDMPAAYSTFRALADLGA